ncbi:MAG: ferric reductase-like transmembrane domain-containing protein [Desulfamplus sp.]|nr:ferric reductase-like transmembrane domain-containing protein [Desulfamplus sp.]
MISFLKPKSFLFLVLSIPAIPIVVMGMEFPWTDETYAKLIHVSGEMSVRLLLITLFISPLKLLFPKASFWKWMMKHRRYFGIASFLYLTLHLGVYILHLPEVLRIFSDFYKSTYFAGWLAFIILLILALTSNSRSIKKLGVKNWKNVQRFVYLAVLLSAMHWLFKEELEIGPVIVHFIPLLILELIRMYRIHSVSTKQTSN